VGAFEWLAWVVVTLIVCVFALAAALIYVLLN
jgi:hypothetical protein